MGHAAHALAGGDDCEECLRGALAEIAGYPRTPNVRRRTVRELHERRVQVVGQLTILSVASSPLCDDAARVSQEFNREAQATIARTSRALQIELAVLDAVLEGGRALEHHDAEVAKHAGEILEAMQREFEATFSSEERELLRESPREDADFAAWLDS